MLSRRREEQGGGHQRASKMGKALLGKDNNNGSRRQLVQPLWAAPYASLKDRETAQGPPGDKAPKAGGGNGGRY